MVIQIFGTKKCRNTQKALRFFKERGIEPHFIDLNEKKLSKGELTNISRSVPLEQLIDKEGSEYAKKNLKYMAYDPEEILLENPLLLKTPVVRNGKTSTAGVCPEIWNEWLKQQ